MASVNGRPTTDTHAVEFNQSQRQTTVAVNGKRYDRCVRWVHGDTGFCGCGAKNGQYHHIGCSEEDCPICGGYLQSCGCLNGD
jgi:hypothetical protein